MSRNRIQTAHGEQDWELLLRNESLDGKLVNQVRDADYTRGIICLTAWHSMTQFRDPMLRIY